MIHRPYAMSMKTKRKSIAKKSVADSKLGTTPRLRWLIIALAISVLALVLYIFKDYSPSLQQEADGFTKLKLDFLALQKEFNRIDKGWEYKEGCVGRGGVYESDIPHSCGFDLILMEYTYSDISLLAKNYTSVLDTSNKFSYKKKTETLFRVSSFSFPNAQCSMQIGSTPKNGGKSYLTLGCSATAHYFHFPRTDK